MPSHYLNQYWNIVKWTLTNLPQWNFNLNSNLFIKENAFENVILEMAGIFAQPQCVNACMQYDNLIQLIYTLLNFIKILGSGARVIHHPLICFVYLLYPPLQRSWKGVYWFHLVRLSVCPSARLPVCPSVDRIVSALYLQQYSSDPFHICTS